MSPQACASAERFSEPMSFSSSVETPASASFWLNAPMSMPSSSNPMSLNALAMSLAAFAFFLAASSIDTPIPSSTSTMLAPVPS